MHSRLLLISTSKSVSEIGHECAFPNTSHFIKLFKKEYSITPSAYRVRHLEAVRHSSEKVSALHEVREVESADMEQVPMAVNG